MIPKRRKLLLVVLSVAFLPLAGVLAMIGVPPFAGIGTAALDAYLPHGLTNGYADLRNEAVRTAGPAEYERGRHVLASLARRHGLEAWKTHDVFRVVAVDEWNGSSPYWPEPSQRFTHDQLLGTFSSRLTLNGGPRDGESWGIQSWSPYVVTQAEQAAEWIGEDDPRFSAIHFYLPTLQYFNELVFRLLRAPVAVYADSEILHGRAYHKVYVTWEEGPPSGSHDHYVLWIDEETGLLSKVHYTIREAPRFAPAFFARFMRAVAVGTMHFSDYREIDGVKFPFDQIVTALGPTESQADPSEGFFHRLRVEAASFEQLSAETLMPDPSRGVPADRK